MMDLQQQRDWVQQQVTDFDNTRAANADRFQGTRSEARDALKLLPGLHYKQEAWRYSRIDQLFEQDFHAPARTVADEDMEKILPAGLDSYRLVFVNGDYQAACSTTELPRGLRLLSLQSLLQQGDAELETFFADTEHTEHLLTALNSAMLQDGAVLYLEKNQQLDKPVELVYLNTADGASMHTRNLVVLGEAAEATLVERFVGEGEAAYFANNLSDIHLLPGASLKHISFQAETRQAFHLNSIFVQQQRQSHYAATSLAFGAHWSRTDVKLQLQQEFARCELNGLYMAGDEQLNDYHLDVQHQVPHCTSREQFRGILYGKGRGVFDGHILVDKQAQKSDAELTNDNLLLTRSAEVDTKPQLEIYADDVKCSHGTTVGQLDEQQIFYMRSRGLTENRAKTLLCQGFASEIIDSIDQDTLHELAREQLNATLQQVVANV